MNTPKPYEVRRKLLNMTTHDVLIFGELSVRLYVNQNTIRWQIDSREVKQSYRYPRFADVDYLDEYDDPLIEVVHYIMANYASEPFVSERCLYCKKSLHGRKAKYCNSYCRQMGYRQRQRSA